MRNTVQRVLAMILAVILMGTVMPGGIVEVTAETSATRTWNNPITGTVQGAGYDESSGHYGIDLYPYNYGDPVYAVASGTMMYSCPRNHTTEYQSGDDLCSVKIILDEPLTHNGTTYVCAFYTHMSALVYDVYCGYNSSCVKEYNEGLREGALPSESIHVEAGDLIGYVGKGNGATHLHFSFEAAAADDYAMMPNSEYYEVFGWDYGETIEANETSSVTYATTSSVTNDIQSKLDSFISQYPDGSRWTGSFDDGIECYGFAKLVIYNLFGGSTVSGKTYRSWSYAGVSTSGMNVVGSTTSYSADSVSNLLSMAQCGDVLQFDSPKKHSMIVYSVAGDGVYIYDCNWDLKCGIRLQKCSFGAWSGRNSNKLTLLRSDNAGTTTHTHSYTITEYEAAHPHKVYLRCSTCGATGAYTGATTYVSGCSSCNTCSCSTSYAGTYVCATESLPLNIRDGHSTGSNIIGQIPSGATVTVTAGNGTWAHVTYNGVSGYASMEYLTKPYTTSGTYPVPFKCYPLSSADHAANAYDAPGGNLIGYIYGTDYCTVKAVYSNGYCLVNCPWEGSTKDVYALTSAFLNTSCTPTTKVAEQKATTYIRLGSSTTLGWIDAGDTIVIVDNTNSTRTQVIYPHTDGIYRCAWVDVSALVHTHTYGAAATCTTAQYCTTCDTQLAPALGHSAGTAATCTSAQYCTRCSVILAGATGHTPGAPATCTTAQTCTVCGTVLAAASGHQYTAGDYTDPTHPHTIYNVCSCGAMKDSGYTGTVEGCTACYPAPTVGAITYAPTTVVAGDTVTFTFPATGATAYSIEIGDGENVLYASGSVNENTVTYTFPADKVNYTVYVSGTAYNGTTAAAFEPISVSVGCPHASATSGSCTEDRVCTVCGLVLASAPGHTYSAWTYADGTTHTHTCENCGETEQQAHTWDSGIVTTPATETATGVMTYTCTVCSGTKTEVIPKIESSVADTDAQILIKDGKVRAGQTVDIPVLIKNNPGFCQLRLRVHYDAEQMTLEKVTNGELFRSMQVGGFISFAESANVTADGALVILTFLISDSVEAGDVLSLTIENYECSNDDEIMLEIPVVNGVITVSDVQYGDVNGDGSVNGLDATRLLKYLANYDSEGSLIGTVAVEIGEGADVNGDGKISGLDATRLLKYLANYDSDGNWIGDTEVTLGPIAA